MTIISNSALMIGPEQVLMETNYLKQHIKHTLDNIQHLNMPLSRFCLILHDEGSVLMDTGGRKCARTCAWRCATSGSSLSNVRIAWAKCTMPGDKNSTVILHKQVAMLDM